MSEDVSTVVRGNRGTPPVMTTVVARATTWQLDELAITEGTSYQGADPNNTFKAFTTHLPTNDPLLLRLNDVLIDQNIIDEVTGQSRLFRVCSKPVPFRMDNHWELVVTWYRGD